LLPVPSLERPHPEVLRSFRHFSPSSIKAPTTPWSCKQRPMAGSTLTMTIRFLMMTDPCKTLMENHIPQKEPGLHLLQLSLPTSWSRDIGSIVGSMYGVWCKQTFRISTEFTPGIRIHPGSTKKNPGGINCKVFIICLWFMASSESTSFPYMPSGGKVDLTSFSPCVSPENCKIPSDQSLLGQLRPGSMLQVD
jgi:hypothetical protein